MITGAENSTRRSAVKDVDEGTKHEGCAMELHLRHVSKTYANGVQALKDVSLTIPAGLYGLLGPRGAGKSTLMRVLATLEEPDSGTIHFDDVDVVQQKDAVRQRLGYLPQDGGVRRTACAEMIDRLAALAGDATLLILDEPTAGLEPGERARFLKRLCELSTQRVVLLSTSAVEDISDLCTRVAIIKDGRILLEAEPRRAIDELQGRIWHRVIAKEALPRVAREYPVISTKLVAEGPEIHVYSNTAPGVGFERARPDLEDVYFSAIAGHLTAM